MSSTLSSSSLLSSSVPQSPVFERASVLLDVPVEAACVPAGASVGIDAALERFFVALRQKSFAQLCGLEESQEVHLDAEGRMRALLWRDLQADGQLQLVLQALSGGSLCCLGDLVAQGYTVTEAGEWQALGSEALSEFRMG